MKVIIVPDELAVAKAAYTIVKDRLNNDRINVISRARSASLL